MQRNELWRASGGLRERKLSARVAAKRESVAGVLKAFQSSEVVISF